MDELSASDDDGGDDGDEDESSEDVFETQDRRAIRANPVFGTGSHHTFQCKLELDTKMAATFMRQCMFVGLVSIRVTHEIT